MLGIGGDWEVWEEKERSKAEDLEQRINDKVAEAMLGIGGDWEVWEEKERSKAEDLEQRINDKVAEAAPLVDKVLVQFNGFSVGFIWAQSSENLFNY